MWVQIVAMVMAYLTSCQALMLQETVVGTDVADFRTGKHIRSEECIERPLDLVFVLDTSSSISSDDKVRSKQFVHDVISSFDIDSATVRVAVITYATTASVRIDWNQYNSRSSLQNAILQLDLGESGGETYTAEALDLANTQLFAHSRYVAAKVLVLITDGESQDTLDTIRAAQNLKATYNVTVIAVGVGNLVNEDELNGFASSSQHVFLVTGFGQIDDIRSDITSFGMTGDGGGVIQLNFTSCPRNKYK